MTTSLWTTPDNNLQAHGGDLKTLYVRTSRLLPLSTWRVGFQNYATFMLRSSTCSVNAAEFNGTVWFDAICNAFHYKAIRHILPYDPTFDQQTWWASQMSVIIRSEVLFRGHMELFGDNPKHRPYPRDSTSLQICYTI